MDVMPQPLDKLDDKALVALVLRIDKKLIQGCLSNTKTGSGYLSANSLSTHRSRRFGTYEF